MRALRNTVESKGLEDKSYNLALGIAFSPAKNLTAEQLVEAVEKNKAVSGSLVYNMAAGLRKDPMIGISKEQAVAALTTFEQELAALPQEAGAAMTLEFTVSNPHEQEIIEETQKAIGAIEAVESKDIAKLAKKA